MCNLSCIAFGVKHLTIKEVRGKKVIEVGSYDVNGSLRPIVESWGEPAEYLGVDIEKGPGVDVICNAEDIVEKFGKESFDVVISTELLEHVRDWGKAISSIKNICKPNGIILITTRSYGFGYHGYPYDFWRYELEDMEHIFSDCEILALQSDYRDPGVFVKAKKPAKFVEKDLTGYKLYSVVVNKRVREVTDGDLRDLQIFYLLRKISNEKLKKFLFNVVKLLSGFCFRKA